MSETKSTAMSAAESHCGERRGTQRVYRVLYVEIRGQRANYPAMVVNVSPGGVLLSIAAADCPDGSGDVCDMVALSLGRDVRLQFKDVDTAMGASVADVAAGEQGFESVLFVRCNFAGELSEQQRGMLGIGQGALGKQAMASPPCETPRSARMPFRLFLRRGPQGMALLLAWTERSRDKRCPVICVSAFYCDGAVSSIRGKH